MLAILYFGLHWDASQVLGLFVAYFFILAADQVQSRMVGRSGLRPMTMRNSIMTWTLVAYSMILQIVWRLVCFYLHLQLASAASFQTRNGNAIIMDGADCFGGCGRCSASGHGRKASEQACKHGMCPPLPTMQANSLCFWG